MKQRKSLAFGVLLVLQILFLTGMAASYYAVDSFGTEVRLKTAPVDPRDLFYGDYVQLSYEISELPWSMWKGTEKPAGGQTVYVVVHREGEHDTAVGVYPDKPDTQAGETVLPARVQRWGSEEQLNLVYGFERYYVEENTGKELEEKREQATVTVKVAPWGQPKVTGLTFAGEKR
ncbi:GDYXXLXY domain-containing protein [Aneurinibacillus sp. REN35]|uniref:GDYXXLXY domain-containing protein n=1 Tax=Aneurinibacillus sp. REN35 TaxID=3237286 RepID=UPI0035287321